MSQSDLSTKVADILLRSTDRPLDYNGCKRLATRIVNAMQDEPKSIDTLNPIEQGVGMVFEGLFALTKNEAGIGPALSSIDVIINMLQDHRKDLLNHHAVS